MTVNAKPAIKKVLADAKLARKGDYFLIMIPNYWSRGTTVEETLANLKSNSGKDIRKVPWVLYSVSPDTTVNEMGGLRYPKKHLPIKIDQSMKDES